ncbi:uncharacterized protein [Euphorbia lathyris]|uniref:uncharacterized protein isoform X4 n=1 Tax=Euphorbia lathyris TaxID=212925 RepID=UPI0033138D7F
MEAPARMTTTQHHPRSQQLGDFGCCNSIWGFLDSSMKNSTYLKWQSMLLIYVQLLVAGVRNVQLQVLSCKLYLPAKLSQDSRLWKSKVVLQLAPSLQQQPFKIIECQKQILGVGFSKDCRLSSLRLG